MSKRSNSDTSDRGDQSVAHSFSHLDRSGRAQMVDVSDKPITWRTAEASGRVRMRSETRQAVKEQQMAKGDVLQVARLAGIMAAKQTDHLIPLCHSLPLDEVRVDFEFEGDDTIVVRSFAGVSGKTGVEMEALTSVAVAALTIYDMCKSADRSIVIDSIQLEKKSGGRSGSFTREEKTE